MGRKINGNVKEAFSLKKSGWTNQAIADKLDVSAQTIANWLSKKQPVTSAEQFTFCPYCGHKLN